jgi:hypothetical protein
MRAVSSAYCAKSTWRDGVGMSFTYRLKGTGETIPPCATPAHMTRLVDVAVLKDVRNIRPSRYEDMILTK